MVIVTVNKDKFTLDGYLKSNLDIMKGYLKKDFDLVIICDGRERYGKSTLAAQMAYYLDPTYNIDRCVFTPEQFKEAVEDAKPFQAIVFDEAHSYLNSRSSMSRFNKQLINILTQMGSRNLIIIICLPNFFELDKYPAIFRSSVLLHIHRRAAFTFYNYKKKKNLYLKGKRFYTYNVSANFYGPFVKFFPLDKEQYEAKKRDSLTAFEDVKFTETKLRKQRDIALKYIHNLDKVTITFLSKLVGISKSQMQRVLAKEIEYSDPSQGP